MSKAHDAIIREHELIPTVEELLEYLNGKGVCSNLVFKYACHPIFWDETNRLGTTSVTHRDLYRYEHLMFGIKFRIREIPANLSGSDQELWGSCQYCRWSECSPGRKKGTQPKGCVWRSLALLRMLENVSSDLVNKNFWTWNHWEWCETKRRENWKHKRCRTPRNSNEVRSFRGLLQFVYRFIPDLSSVAEPIQRLNWRNVMLKWGQ